MADSTHLGCSTVSILLTTSIVSAGGSAVQAITHALGMSHEPECPHVASVSQSPGVSFTGDLTRDGQFISGTGRIRIYRSKQ